MLEYDTATLADSNVARPPMTAQKAYLDIEGGVDAGNENQSFKPMLGGQDQHIRCPLCPGELSDLVIVDNFASSELILEQWVLPFDQAPVRTSSEETSTAASQTQQELGDALDDLSEVLEEAEEKGYQIPTETAISEAKRLLVTMYEIAPRRFEVYPMPEGEVTIDATNENGHYLMLLIASDGSARGLSNSANGRSRRHFNSISDIPHEFLRESMLDIDVSNG